MNYETLERALESIAEAKRELIRAEATKATAKTLEAAYAALTQAEKSIAKLLLPSNPQAS